jgi:hypothetical protein
MGYETACDLRYRYGKEDWDDPGAFSVEREGIHKRFPAHQFCRMIWDIITYRPERYPKNRQNSMVSYHLDPAAGGFFGRGPLLNAMEDT